MTRHSRRWWPWGRSRSCERVAALAAELDVAPETLRRLDHHLPRGDAAAAVLGGEGHPYVSALRRLRPHTTLTVVDPVGDPSDRHVTLAAAAPYDLVLDLGPHGGWADRLVDTVFLLRERGLLVIPGGAEEGVREPSLSALVSRVHQAREQGKPPKGAARRVKDAHALARATYSLTEEGRDLVAIGRDLGARAKLDEPEMAAYLERAPSAHRVVSVLPGAPFTSRCDVRESGPDRGAGFATVIRPPDISLRAYHDVVVSPRQVVVDDRVMMPDSFRHNRRARLVNKATDDLAPRFARVPGVDDASALEGTWYHLDNEVRGHFGHLMTETLSRLWAWPLVKQQHPDARVLLGRTRKRPHLQPWEQVLLAAGGIQREDIVLIDRPVRVRNLLSATPMFSNPDYVHPRIAETWDRVGDVLQADAGPGERPERIFCTRREDEERPCRNADEVESIFASHGFAIVHPAEFSLPEQVAMFRSARVVAGFAGSGLFQLCLARDPKHVITIGSSRYGARNEYLIASVRGHRLDAIRSEPEEDHFHSGFTFDHAREGRHLADVLAGT